MNKNELELGEITNTLSKLEKIDESKRTDEEKELIEYLSKKRKNILENIL